MNELTRRALVDQAENIIADYDERELSSTDWEGLNRDELACISECLQFGALKTHGTAKIGCMNLGAILALQGVKEEIQNIVSELERKGIDKPKGFSVLQGYIDDRFNELYAE